MATDQNSPLQETHEFDIEDRFLFLEDASDPATIAWSRQQAAISAAWHAQRPELSTIERTLVRLTRAESCEVPRQYGGRTFQLRKRSDDERRVLFVGSGADARELYNPLTVDPSGNTSLDGWFPSRDGDKVALVTSTGGTEEAQLTVVVADTGQLLDGPIPGVRATSVAWMPGGDEFFYTRRQSMEDGARSPRIVLRHRLGAAPEDDRHIDVGVAYPNSYYGLQSSHDGRWLAVGTRQGSSPSKGLWLVHTATGGSARQLISDEDDCDVVGWFESDGRLHVRLAQRGERGRLVVVDPDDPRRETWLEVLSEDPLATLKTARLIESSDERRMLVALWIHDGASQVTIHDAESGHRRAEVPLPGSGNVTGIAVDDGQSPGSARGFWLGYTDFVSPPCAIRYEISASGQPLPQRRDPALNPASARTVIEKVEYSSSDGSPVGMTLVYRDQGAATGPRPVLLTAYGGYGSVMTPGYSAVATAWVAAGGVWAYAAVRGGGEKGRDWHDAGRLDKKINAIEDFNAAAGHLIDTGWSDPTRMCALGQSNGGLVVSAAAVRRPDLYRAVVCIAPLTDMLRYHELALGANGLTEYGDPRDPQARAWLREYSPYHNVCDGLRYPAMQFIVGSSDTRVDPAHSRKLCARLQAAAERPDSSPVLIHVEERAGHGALSVTRGAALAARQLAFLGALAGITWPQE